MGRATVGIILALIVARAGEISGVVMQRDGEPASASMTLLSKGSDTAKGIVRTDARGAYRFTDLPPADYKLLIQAAHTSAVTISPIHLGPGELRQIPIVQMDWPSIYVCDSSGHNWPRDYRLADTAQGMGGLNGIMLGDDGSPVPRAIRTLYAPGTGKLATTVTTENGDFTFNNLKPGAAYWIRIEAEGYFADELTGLVVQAGLNSAYTKHLEACEPGRCDPTTQGHHRSYRLLLNPTASPPTTSRE